MLPAAMTDNDKELPSVFKFGGKGFRLWQQKVLFALELRDLDEVVKTAPAEHVTPTDAAQKANKKARAFICSHLEDHVLQSVLQQDLKSAHAVWVFIKSRYDICSRSEKGRTVRDFWNCEKDQASCQEFVTRLQEKASDAKAVGSTITDDEIINKLLCSMPMAFNPIIAQFDQKTNLELVDIVTALISEERRLESQSMKIESAHVTQIDALKSRIAELEAGGARPVTVCTHCKRRGHRQDRCWKLHPELQPKRHVIPNTTLDVHAYSSVLPTSSEASSSEDWLLDCGCSHHMSPSVLNSQPISARSGVVMGNSESIPIVGRGSKTCCVPNCKINLDDVLHVPRLGKNLLSIGQSTAKGLKFLFEDDSCKIFTKDATFTPSLTPLTVIKKGQDNLYHTSEAVHARSIFATYAKRQSHAKSFSLWHQRLAHLNEADVLRLAQAPESEIKISNSDLSNPCEGCILGKMTRGKFSPARRKPETLDVMEVCVIDLGGRLRTSSIQGGSWYWMIILDKREGWRDVHFLKNKSDATDIIIQHDRRAVRRLGERVYRIQTIRTDNGGEFVSGRLKEYFLENGISHETIVPHVHEQVGDVERENRTLFEKAQAMRLASGLPDEFWAEAMATATYLANRSPSSSRNFKTPYEIRYGKPPCLSHLRVFGFHPTFKTRTQSSTCCICRL